MSFGRFVLGVISGACALWIFLFYKMSFGGYDSTGVILWSGVINGHFEPTYFAMLYVPPLLLAACLYFAVRRPSGD
jgi:hypothetical protein